MPWNDQSGGGGGQRPPGGPSGGPWGDGPKNPWGGPPRQPNPPPNNGGDLEDMIKRMQDRMKGGPFGGRGGGRGDSEGRGPGPAGFAVLGALLVAGWFVTGAYIVDEGEQAVVSRLGAFDRVSPPGFHVHLPPPIETHEVVQFTRQRRTQIGGEDSQTARAEDSLMLTGDEAIVDIDFTVIWSLKDAKSFVFNIAGQEKTVADVAESAMREVVGQRTLEGIITTDRAAVEDGVRMLMQSILDSYQSGVLINQVQLQKASAPAQVIDAFDDVVRASQDAETKINEATRYRNEVVPQARGEAQRMLQEAEGYKTRVVREATGEGERFRLIQEQYRTAPRVTRERLYLETMERVYGNADKTMIDGRTGAVPVIPLDSLRRPQVPVAPSTAPAAPAAPQQPAPGAR
jgi:modulator of FtsH protease HflK